MTKRPTTIWKPTQNLLHIECPGCIVNIYVDLADDDGNPVTSVIVEANGQRYAGQPEWWIEGERGKNTFATRVVRGAIRRLRRIAA